MPSRPRPTTDVVFAYCFATTAQAAFDGPAGLDLPSARTRLEERRDQLRREQVRVAKMLHTFRGISRRYGKVAS